jgi:hypothetical protein
MTNTDTGRYPIPRALLGPAGLLLAGSLAEMAGHGGATIRSGLLGVTAPGADPLPGR